MKCPRFSRTKERRITEFFRLSVMAKGVVSAAEIIAGVFVLVVPISTITDLVIRLAQGELDEDPTDFLATHLVTLAHQVSVSSSLFVAVYLLSRGLIKLGLVVALLKNQLWAYPASLVVLGLFILYQVYQLVILFSPLLLALTIFDLFVMWFIWREYEVVRSHQVGRA